MFLELIATFAAGIGAAGMVLALNLITGGRLPRWAMPVAAGLAMIGVTISNEVSWGNRTASGLPEGVEVVDEVTEAVWYRPWSYFAPPVVRLVALDTQSAQTNPNAPDVLLVDMYLMGRWQPSAKVPQLVQCAQASQADVTEAALASPADANWRPADSRLIAAACKDWSNDG